MVSTPSAKIGSKMSRKCTDRSVRVVVHVMIVLSCLVLVGVCGPVPPHHRRPRPEAYSHGAVVSSNVFGAVVVVGVVGCLSRVLCRPLMHMLVHSSVLLSLLANTMKAMVASLHPSRFLEMVDQLREWSARIGSDAAVGAMVTYLEDISATLDGTAVLSSFAQSRHDINPALLIRYLKSQTT